MKKFSRRKIALALACASILGGRTQAMNKPQSQKTVAAVGGATDKNSNKGFANWAKNHKWKLAVGIGVPVVAATASILAFLGVKYWGKKDNDGDPNKKPNINNPDVNNPNKSQQTENKSNDGENNPEKDPIKVLKVDINQAQVNPKKETIQVQNPINANPISVPIPVVQKVEPKQESIIEKNIAKIKLESDKNIANETFELFFDKVESIRCNKDKLVASKVDSIGRFDYELEKFVPSVIDDDEGMSKKDINNAIKLVIEGTIESLYNKDGVGINSKLSVWKNGLELTLGGNKVIKIFKDGRLCLGNDNCRIYFNKDLGAELKLTD